MALILCYHPFVRVERKTTINTKVGLPRRSEVARTHKQEGGLIAAVLPIHYPRSLFRAFNILPMEVWGPPRVDISYGAAHLQPYVCSIVRNALSFLLSGGLNVADLVVVPHACDSLQGFGSILLDFVKPTQSVIPLYLPRRVDKGAMDFLADEFRSLYSQLKEITQCTPSDKDLMESIQREEVADKLLGRLHQTRRTVPLSDFEFYRLLRGREYLTAEMFSELALAVLEGHKETEMNGIPIILSGIVPEPMEMLKSISEFGGLVVADDLACCGRRIYPSGKQVDPFLRMAERILAAPPDWSHGSSIQDRLENLTRMIERSGAKGVVFYDVKFCEPELFDLPDLRKDLQKSGVPSITVEVDISDPLSNQTLTRIEAFLEMFA